MPAVVTLARGNRHRHRHRHDTDTDTDTDTEREGEENTAAIGATSPRNRDGQTLAVRRHSQRDDWRCTEISDWCRAAASPRIRESHERLAE